MVTRRLGSPRWSIVLPIKSLTTAKSRLAEPAGARRADLVLAMAIDTVTAALRCELVEAVVVVTDDPKASAALRSVGARVLRDTPAAGLNAALAHGVAASRANGQVPVATLPADLPALRPHELTRALNQAARYDRCVVPDAEGTGTTLLTANAGVACEVAYGPGSFARHLVTGAHPLDTDEMASLLHDVDTVADLQASARLGLGVHTLPVAKAMGALA